MPFDAEGQCLKVLQLAQRANDIALGLAQKNLAVFHRAKVGGVRAWIDTWKQAATRNHGTAAPPIPLPVVSRMVSFMHAKLAALPEDIRVLYSEAYLGLADLLHRYSAAEIGQITQDIKVHIHALLAEEPSQAVRRSLSSAMDSAMKV